jgi:hypothetical protein
MLKCSVKLIITLFAGSIVAEGDERLEEPLNKGFDLSAVHDVKCRFEKIFVRISSTSFTSTFHTASPTMQYSRDTLGERTREMRFYTELFLRDLKDWDVFLKKRILITSIFYSM